MRLFSSTDPSSNHCLAASPHSPFDGTLGRDR